MGASTRNQAGSWKRKRKGQRKSAVILSTTSIHMSGDLVFDLSLSQREPTPRGQHATKLSAVSFTVIMYLLQLHGWYLPNSGCPRTKNCTNHRHSPCPTASNGRWMKLGRPANNIQAHLTCAPECSKRGNVTVRDIAAGTARAGNHAATKSTKQTQDGPSCPQPTSSSTMTSIF